MRNHFGMKKNNLLLLAAFLLTSLLSFSQQQLDKEIAELMEEGDIPGLSVVMINGDKQVIKTFGYSNLQTMQPVTAQTLFQLGSCSKSFTALAITALTQEGKIDLDAPVSRYIPWLELYYNKQKAQVTLRQLLHHTSGIPWNTIAKIPETNADDALEQTVKVLVGQKLHNAPGARFEYATINYDVLALVIQTVTGEPFESYIQKNVIDRLQLTSTSIGAPADASQMSAGYKIGFFEERKYNAPVFKGNNAAGYIISNATDMAEWLKFQMGLTHPGMQPLVQLTHQRDESVALHGLSFYAEGWEVALDGTGEIFHGGLNPNFTAYVAFRPEKKLGVVVMANSNSSYTALIGNTIMKRMAGEKVEKQLNPGDNNDKTYSLLSIIIVAYILVVLGFLGRLVMQVMQGKRKYEALTWNKVKNFALSVAAVLPFVYGVYILPQALAGFNWQAILVWTPGSFAFLIWSLAAAAGLSYIAHFISVCFPGQDKYRRMAPRLVLMSVLSGLANVIVIVMVTSAIGSDSSLKYNLFYYGLVLCVYLLGRRYVQVTLIKLTRGLVYELRLQLVEKIFSTPYQKFEKLDRGRIYTTLNDDINTIGESTNMFMMLITSTITACGAFLFLAFIAFWATLLTIFLVVSLAAIYFFVAYRTNKYFEQARDERSVFMRLINGMIDGFKELSLRRKTKLQYKDDVAVSAEKYRNKLTVADTRFVNAFLVGESLLVVLLGAVAFGMPQLFPEIKFYTLMSFVIILLYLIGPINGILTSAPTLMQFRVALGRIRGFLKEIPANLNLNEPVKPLVANVESIKMKGVKFRYKNDDDKHVFEVGPIDLEARKGEVLFIIGGNGSGKTTLAKLLIGLYSPDEGAILVNNKPIESSQLSEYFSTVFSPSYLFEKLYNIDADAKLAEINKYLKVLDLEEKVSIKENRYSTIELSSGQRKRLALLQCYLEDSPVYLFDEWAADQDPDYRNFFYRTLLPEMKKQGKIIIAITHDDNYFDVADHILKMKQGKIEIYSNDYTILHGGLQKPAAAYTNNGL
jgi:putative pyoverdin transport system ATP-binding/permease protein